MNERELRIGFEGDGMSEAEIERALDQHEAGLLDEGVEDAVVVPRSRHGGTGSLLAAAAMSSVGVPRWAVSRVDQRGVRASVTKYPRTRGKVSPAGSKLARKAAKGKL